MSYCIRGSEELLITKDRLGMDVLNPNKYKILLVDDYPLVRRMIRGIIEGQPDLQVVGEFNDGRELLNYLKSESAHLILMDLSMPNLGGFEATLITKETYPEVKVLILTIHKSKAYLEQAMALGAEGYLLKEEVDEHLLPAINSLRQGKTFISPRLFI
jgi:DNA-binding NarL/FixJ family response regulator